MSGTRARFEKWCPKACRMLVLAAWREPQSMRRALIIGAGPGGLTTAIALRQAGIEACVFERATRLQDSGSGLTLWPNAFKALERVGAADAVRAACRPLSGIALYSWRGDLLSATPGPALEKLSGGTGAALHRTELVAALLALVGHGQVTLGARCLAVRQGQGRVTALFADGREVTGDLLLGADGLRSVVARQLFGPLPLRYAGYPVWRGVADLESEQGVGVTMLGRGAQFGYFPMSRSRVYWFAALNAPAGGDWRGPVQTAGLLARFGDWHGPVRALIEATDERSIVATDIYERRPLRRWGVGRVSLIGDAAHPSPPNLGQGACQAIEDAVVLGECLAGVDDVPAALRAYESRRIRRANAMTDQARRMSRMGQCRGRAACWLRDWLIKATPSALGLRNLRWMFDFQA